MSVKKAMETALGKEIPAEEFSVPKDAYNILAKEYDLLLEESSALKVSAFFFFLNLFYRIDIIVR